MAIHDVIDFPQGRWTTISKFRGCRQALGLFVVASTTSVCASAHWQLVVNVVAKTGDPAPGLPGEVFLNAEAPRINDAGDLALNANLASSNGAFNGKRGAFLWSGQTLQKLIATGDAAPSGFPSSTYQQPGVSRLDNSGVVLLQSSWPGSGATSNGLHAFVPGVGSFILQVPGATPHPQWPSLWAGSYDFLLAGGKFLDRYFQQVFGGTVGEPFQVLNTPDTVLSFGWPCSNMRLGQLYWNSITDEGVVPFFSSVPCGYPAFGSLGSTVVGVLNVDSGAIAERDRACPFNAGNPPQQCGPTASRSINNYFATLNGNFSYEREQFDGNRILVRNGIVVGSLTSWASDFLLPDETLHSVSGSVLGEDGTLLVVFAARKTDGSGTILVGHFAVNPDGSTSLLGRQGQAIEPGGPVYPLGPSLCAPSAQGTTWMYIGNTVWSWRRTRGWKRVLGAGDQVRLRPHEQVGTLTQVPSVIMNTYAGKDRGMNASGLLAVSLTVTIQGQSGSVSVAGTVDLRKLDCPADLNSDGFVDDGDFVEFASAYNVLDCADPAMPSGCGADLNSDGLVDDADFVLFASAYDELLCP
jgi:hypothetical protein